MYEYLSNKDMPGCIGWFVVISLFVALFGAPVLIYVLLLGS